MTPTRTTVRVLDAATIEALADMPRVIEVVRAGFVALSQGRARAPERGVVASPRGTTLVMGGWIEGTGLVGKIVSVFPGNPSRTPSRPSTSGLVVALDPETGAPIGLLDGGALTAWRTGAASGAATELLARRDARIAAVIGCGVQARTQALAIDAVRGLDELRVYAPRPARVADFVARLQPQVRARVVASASARAAVTGAAIVCAATSSRTPVFPGEALSPGAHVNGVGSFRLDMRELDARAVARARVYVDHRPAALAEAGELVAAADEGVSSPGDWIELGAALAGAAPGRAGPDEITLFKSVGLAIQDVAAAGALIEAAARAGLGQEVRL